MMMYVLRLALVVLAIGGLVGCGAIGALRPGPTVAPLISAAFLTVHLVTGDSSDAQERARLPGLRDGLAGALPGAWATATAGRGQLALRTDADIDVELAGNEGTSALTQHSRGGKVVSRTIAVHTIEGGRRLSLPELLSTTLHELGHIWCCYGPGTVDGHWADPPSAFSPVGLMYSPMRCQVAAGSEPVCPTVFSERELAEMRL
jgi:hypothetical protein